LYNVAKYFDDHFEGNVATNLILEEAKKTQTEYENKTTRAYVSYEVRKAKKVTK